MTVELLPHQIKAVNELSNGKVLVGGVGVGKTPTALVYFFTKVMGGVVGDFGSIQRPMDLYVFTTARKRDSLDWQDWAIKLGISTNPEFSVGHVRLVVESYNNIDKFKDVKNAFIILDEQRMVGSGSWSKTFIHLAKNNQWIMLSATPGDKWEDYIPLFVANGFYKNRSEFKREHCVYSYYGRYPKLERYLVVGKLVRLRNSILVEMPYQKHTRRHIYRIPVEYDRELFEKVVKKRWHVYENRPLKDISEMFSVMRKVVNSDESRVQAVSSLMKNHPRLIVFYNFDYELEILRSLGRNVSEESLSLTSSAYSKRLDEEKTKTLLRKETNSLTNLDPNLCPLIRECSTSLKKDSMDGITNAELKNDGSSNRIGIDSVTIAEWNGHKHEAVPTSERWVYLVQYVAGAEAWNCTSTDTVVFYSLTYSYKNFEQAQGRIDRLNTPYLDLNYYVLQSSSPIDVAVARSLKGKKNFNEKDLTLYT